MEYVIEKWDQILLIIGALVGAFSAIATLTPNQTDNKIANVLLKGVNLLGMNVGKAQNKND